MRSRSKSRNSIFNWDHFDTDKYYEQYVSEIIWEDKCLARATIGALLELDIPLKSKKNAIDICNGGVARGPMLLSPFIRDEGIIEWADYGEPQLAAARHFIQRGADGDLEFWGTHQSHMNECHSAWADAGVRACKLGKAVKRSIFELPENRYDLGITCFGPESLTADNAEWQKAVQKFLSAIKPGGGVVMLYMVGSRGYNSAGEAYPATSIDMDDVRQATKSELKQTQHFFVSASHGARPKNDIYGYDGMGAVIGKRR